MLKILKDFKLNYLYNMENIVVKRYQDKWNEQKEWVVKRYPCGHYTLTQYICDTKFGKTTKFTKQRIKEIGIFDMTCIG